MKRCLIGLLALAAAVPAASDAKPAPKWRKIFDGRTLTGWTPKITGQRLGSDPRRTFVVRDGAIHVSYRNYGKFDGQFGHLAWHRPVGAFRLRFEYRFTGAYLPDVEAWQHSNSGLMFHGQAPATMTRHQKFPVSLELQLNGTDGPLPSTGNLCTPGTNVVIAGELETEHCIPSSSPTIPNGRWTRVEVEARADGRIAHRIDGKTVLTYSAPQLDPEDADAKPLIAEAGGALALDRGYLYLQSEGHPVEFRRIELMTLD